MSLWKRDTGNANVDTESKTASAIFSASNVPTGEPCCNIYLTVTQNYNSNDTPIGALKSEKIAEAVFKCISIIAFLASLFIKIHRKLG